MGQRRIDRNIRAAGQQECGAKKSSHGSVNSNTSGSCFVVLKIITGIGGET